MKKEESDKQDKALDCYIEDIKQKRNNETTQLIMGVMTMLIGFGLITAMCLILVVSSIYITAPCYLEMDFNTNADLPNIYDGDIDILKNISITFNNTDMGEYEMGGKIKLSAPCFWVDELK